jgi:hypothetical protein
MTTPEQAQRSGRIPSDVPETTGTSEGNSETAWRGWWQWDVLLSIGIAFVAALLVPLDDTDLPMHLRTGAWILEHQMLPLQEPFAWTRAGAPFYAYSWLPEVLYALGWRAGGADGLTLVHAVLVALTVGATWDLARVARWSPWSTRLIVSIHLILWILVQPATRPQLVLAAVIPLSWAAAIQLRERRDGSAVVGALVRAVVAAVVAVNSHLFFALTLVPGVVLLAARPLPWRAILQFAAATAVGWMCTPYVAHLPAVLQLNLGGNPLIGPASPIMELEGGFSMLTHAALGTRILLGVLLLLPFLPTTATLSQRERWWYGMAWLAGLGLFGLAVRGLLLWWLLALPLVAQAFAGVPLPQQRLTRRLVVAAWVLSIVGIVGQTLTARQRMPRVDALPHSESVALAPAVRWLDCLVGDRPSNSPLRGTTIFNYGSFLTWRLPQVSWSMDGRSIFPDSVAVAEVRQELRNGPPVEPPWRSGDLAILPPGHASLARIAGDSGWTRVPLTRVDTVPAAELWVRTPLRSKASRCAAAPSTLSALRN